MQLGAKWVQNSKNLVHPQLSFCCYQRKNDGPGPKEEIFGLHPYGGCEDLQITPQGRYPAQGAYFSFWVHFHRADFPMPITGFMVVRLQ